MTQAVIEIAGHQHFIKEGQIFGISKHLDLKPGETLDISEVLLVVDDQKTTVGTPFVTGAKVTLKVIELGKEDKISVFRYKSKSRHRRHIGHRQPQTILEVEKVSIS